MGYIGEFMGKHFDSQSDDASDKVSIILPALKETILMNELIAKIVNINLPTIKSVNVMTFYR